MIQRVGPDQTSLSVVYVHDYVLSRSAVDVQVELTKTWVRADAHRLQESPFADAHRNTKCFCHFTTICIGDGYGVFTGNNSSQVLICAGEVIRATPCEAVATISTVDGDIERAIANSAVIGNGACNRKRSRLFYNCFHSRRTSIGILRIERVRAWAQFYKEWRRPEVCAVIAVFEEAGSTRRRQFNRTIQVTVARNSRGRGTHFYGIDIRNSECRFSHAAFHIRCDHCVVTRSQIAE